MFPAAFFTPFSWLSVRQTYVLPVLKVSVFENVNFTLHDNIKSIPAILLPLLPASLTDKNPHRWKIIIYGVRPIFRPQKTINCFEDVLVECVVQKGHEGHFALDPHPTGISIPGGENGYFLELHNILFVWFFFVYFFVL